MLRGVAGGRIRRTCPITAAGPTALGVRPSLWQRPVTGVTEFSAEFRRQGMSEHDADEAAVRRFGDAGAPARQLRPFSLPLRIMVTAGALATGMIALWLCFVILVVLPSRDPERIPLWAGIAAVCFAYATLTLLLVVRGPRPSWLRGAVGCASLAAMAFGAYEIHEMAQAGAHFEGYLLLMGVILAAQGACAFAYVALSWGIARRVRAA
jgi:hypothetical protein